MFLFWRVLNCVLIFGLVVAPVRAGAQVLLEVTLQDSLQSDVDSDGVADRGDTLGFDFLVDVLGPDVAEDVVVEIPLDPNTTLVPGSVMVQPIALDDVGQVNPADNLAFIDVLANDRDVDGTLDPATVVVKSLPAQGNTSVNSVSGEIVYEKTGAGASDTFTYTVKDDDGIESREALVTVISNLCPVVVADVFATDQDSDVSGNLFSANGGAADSDPDGDALTVVGLTSPLVVGQEGSIASNGLILVNADGSFSFKPGDDFDTLSPGQTQNVNFQYTVSDGVCEQSAFVTVTVSGVNDCPVAQNDAETVAENSFVSGNVFADNGNGADADADATDSFSVVQVNGAAFTDNVAITLPSGASLTIVGAGQYSYDTGAAFDALAAGETDTDSFTYTISDGDCSDTATFEATITGVNDCPIAKSDGVTTDEETAVNGNLLSDNGSGADSDTDTTDAISVAEIDGAALAGPVTLASGAIVTANADGTFGYDPNGAFNSLNSGQSDSDSFSYTLSDGDCTAAGTVSVNVNGVNDCVDAQNDAFSTDEDNDAFGNVLLDNGSGADTDADLGTTLTITEINGNGALVGTAVVLPSGATVTISASGGLTYDVPATVNNLPAGQQVNESVSYTVSDGACTDTALVSLTITGANDCPLAQNDLFTTDQNTVANGNVLADNGSGADSDLDTGTTLTIVSLNGVAGDVGQSTALPSGATIVLNADGTFAYNPGAQTALPAGAVGGDTITYGLSDGGCTVTGTAILNVTGLNDCPAANNDAFTFAEGVDGSGSVFGDNGTGVDSDVDTGATLTVIEVNGSAANVGNTITLASGATVQINTDGSFAYTQGSIYNTLAAGATTNEAAVTYLLSDGTCTDTATVNIAVTGENDCPVAADDAVTTSQSSAVNGNVLSDNGSGADSDPDTANTISVTAVNGAADSVGQQITLASGALLTLNADGTFTYNPNGVFDALNAGQNASDSFAYTLSDGACAVNATASLTIQGLNDCADARADQLSTDESASVNANILADNGSGADSDPDTGATITVDTVNGVAPAFGVATGLPSGALLTVAANGDITYNPNGAFDGVGVGETGSDSFTYGVTDGSCGDTDTVTITINGLNDCPVAQNDALTTDEDTTLIGGVFADNGSGVDADPDTTDSINVSALNGNAGDVGVATVLASGATLTLNADGTFSYAPAGIFDSLATGANTIDSFSYTILDDAGCPATATATITINGVNDCPAAQDDAFATDEDTSINGNILNDNGSGADADADTGATITITELDGAAVTFGAATALASGALVTINADGTFTYNPNGAWDSLAVGATGNDTFTYTISDGACADTATATIVITGVNECPNAIDDALTTDEDSSFTGNVLSDNGSGADSDPEGSITVTEVNGVAASVGTQITLASGALLTLNSTGAFSYDPNDSFETVNDGANGNDTFTYTISDGICGDSATATITITGVNDCPVAQDDDFNTDENTVVNGNILNDNGAGADSDVDTGDTISITQIDGTAVAFGVATPIASGATVTVAADGSFTYDTNGAFDSLTTGQTDSDTFAYTISDGACTDVGAVTIDITGVNDCPIANNDAVTTDEDTPTSGDVFANNGNGADSDPEGDAFSIVAVNGAAANVGAPVLLGTGQIVTVNSDGTFSFDPNGANESLNTGGSATPSFTYTINDGLVACDKTATVTVTVTGVNDPPTANGGIL